MKTFRFVCLRCDQTYETDEATYRNDFQCPGCGNKFNPEKQLANLLAIKAGLDSGEIKFRVEVTVTK